MEVRLEMSKSGVEFDRPPVVEVILGAQFAPLSGLSAAHQGWFWRECLGAQWNNATNSPPIPDQFERFGDEQQWEPIGLLRVQFNDGSETTRVRLTRDQGERMIQLQPTRFHYNWRKRDGAYPRYENVRQAFDGHFEQFDRFVRESKIGPLEINQWEITYVDHIPQGKLWPSPADWPGVLPGLFPTGQTLTRCVLESVGGEWHYEIPERKGRLHIAASTGRIGDSREQVLGLHLTARGPARTEQELKTGLDLGHEVIVQTFVEITSQEAHRAWGRRQ